MGVQHIGCQSSAKPCRPSRHNFWGVPRWHRRQTAARPRQGHCCPRLQSHPRRLKSHGQKSRRWTAWPRRGTAVAECSGACPRWRRLSSSSSRQPLPLLLLVLPPAPPPSGQNGQHLQAGGCRSKQLRRGQPEPGATSRPQDRLSKPPVPSPPSSINPNLSSPKINKTGPCGRGRA